MCLYIGCEKITENEFECVFSFLPFSNVTYVIKDENARFFLFKEHKKIGSGMLLAKIIVYNILYIRN